MKSKQDLYTHFFNTIRMYMVKDSIWNRYDDVILYYSFDQDKFLKRHQLNKKPIGNWIVIPHNKFEMFYLKENLNLRKKEDISLFGRIIYTSREKDEMWDKFMKYVNETFNNFYEIYEEKTKIKDKNEKETAKRLF